MSGRSVHLILLQPLSSAGRELLIYPLKSMRSGLVLYSLASTGPRQHQLPSVQRRKKLQIIVGQVVILQGLGKGLPDKHDQHLLVVHRDDDIDCLVS